MRLQPFDLLCVAGDGRVSSAIRWATSREGNPAEVSHVSFVVEAGDLYSAVIQEALVDCGRIVRRTLAAGYEGTADRVAIYRALNITGNDRQAMMAAADATLGKGYGYGNIVLQLIDAMVGKLARRPVRFARRFATSRWQECVHNVAVVWQAAGYDFGADSGAATPDEVYDFCRTRVDRYAIVRGLEPVPARSATGEPLPGSQPAAPPAAPPPELLPAS